MKIKKKLPFLLNISICITGIVLIIISYLYISYLNKKNMQNEIMQYIKTNGQILEMLAEEEIGEVQRIATDQHITSYIDQMNYSQNQVKDYLEKNLNGLGYGFIVFNEFGEKILDTNYSESEDIGTQSQILDKVLSGNQEYGYVLMKDQKGEYKSCIMQPIRLETEGIKGVLCRISKNAGIEAFIDTLRNRYKCKVYVLTNWMENVHSIKWESQEEKWLSDDTITRLQNITQKSGTWKIQDAKNHKIEWMAYYKPDYMGYTICIKQNTTLGQEQVIKITLFIAGLLSVLSIFINWYSKKIVKQIMSPINLLTQAMNNAAQGDLSSYCDYNEDNEFGELVKHFNTMLTQLAQNNQHLDEVCQEMAVIKKELEYNYSALAESKEALVMSEERYKMALDAIDEVIWEYHVASHHFFATENWSKIIGEDLSGGNINEAINNLLEPQMIESVKGYIQRCLAGEIRDFTQELWITKKYKKCWLLCKGHAIVDNTGKVDKIIGILTDITYNKYNEERMRKLTFFDDLTGCLNKATFIESLDTWLSSTVALKAGALMFIDLDDFKKINDVLSHEIGDKVLNYVGKKLAERLPADAIIGRFGGDEFVVFKTLTHDTEEVYELVYNILNIFQHKLTIDKTNVYLTCSIGVALYPADGEDSAMLLKNADTAMYKVKDNGKNSYSFYTKAMSQTLDRKRLVEEVLREAVAQNSFYLQYQPIVDVATGLTLGSEALIRLYDRDLGFISPGEFIPIAEETDLIIQAGDWVLENALKALKNFHDKGYTYFTININVSSMQIREPNFLNKVFQAIEKINVSPQSVKLEVTETVLMEDIGKSMELFGKVKEKGIKIVLDDFGTGYSSLNYLRNIPLDILKIDKSFIDEITTSKVLSEIVDSIINMAHALDILVVAEGVENEMQLEVLRKKGCDYIQGYYYSKPIGEKELEMRLEQEKYTK